MKFFCPRCGMEYTEEDRKKDLFCDCGTLRPKVSFGRIPSEVPNEIRDYAFEVFEEAGKSFGRVSDQLVYEKAFILLALLKFVCSHSEVFGTKDLLTVYRDHREEIIKVHKKSLKGFKEQGFRTPTSAMPGMAEEEMLGLRQSKLKIGLQKYKQLRTRIMNLSSQECQNSIRFLEIQLKNKLYA